MSLFFLLSRWRKGDILLFQPTGRQYPDGSRVTFSYDDGSNLRTLMHDANGRTTYAYDGAGQGAGQRTSVVNPAGKRITYTYDDVGTFAGSNSGFGIQAWYLRRRQPSEREKGTF